MKKRIHIFGGSGSGTTSIAKAACEALGCRHFDSDGYFWLPTENPFTEERPRAECIAMMRRDLTANERWILSGSIATWGNALIPLFDLAVFVTVPAGIRLERLRLRERERYGEGVDPGGARHDAWAATYDAAEATGRSLQKHEAWIRDLPCPALRIENIDFEESVAEVIRAINA